jgi:hypothetical protein
LLDFEKNFAELGATTTKSPLTTYKQAVRRGAKDSILLVAPRIAFEVLRRVGIKLLEPASW